MAPAPGWYDDPAGKHEKRRFDGTDWTDEVRDGNLLKEDPLSAYAAPVSAADAPGATGTAAAPGGEPNGSWASKTWVPWAAAGIVGLIVGVAIGTGDGESNSETQTVAKTTTETKTVSVPSKSEAELEEVESDLKAARSKLKRTKSKQTEARGDLSDLRESLTSETSAAERGRIDGDGTFVVGEDIDPGTYRAAAQSGCYWARLSSLDTSDIIDNDNADGPVVVEVLSGDKAFQTSGCAEFNKSG